MKILSNKIEVAEKFVAVLRCQYERQINVASKNFLLFFTEAKGDRNASHELWDEYMFWGPAKTLTRTGTGPRTGGWEPVL